jgi:DNA polymerase III sliding clamp (beta) subunit (PCNA family)
VNILHKTLLSAVTMLSKVVETRATLPILSHIVLRQDGTRLHMAGTNMDLFLTLDVTPTTADPERLGDPIAVPAKDLLGVIKSLTDEIVSLKSYVNEEKVARLSVNGVTTEALPIEDFPSEPEPGQKTITLPNLMTAIARVLEVRSPDVSRYAITGIYVDAPQGSVVATDGHRLYGAVIAKAKGFDGILLGDFAKLLVIPTFRKFVTDTLHLDEKKGWHSVPIGSEGITGWFHSRVPEATFPNYEQVMPKDESAKATLTISTAALLAGGGQGQRTGRGTQPGGRAAHRGRPGPDRRQQRARQRQVRPPRRHRHGRERDHRPQRALPRARAQGLHRRHRDPALQRMGEADVVPRWRGAEEEDARHLDADAAGRRHHANANP